VTTVAVSTVELARSKFATTSHNRFRFVPVTLGLAPLVAVMPESSVDLAASKSGG
jgi:cytochrome bd-type quinol oxidase subunit 1